MKDRPYISATIVATLLAIAVWLCLPNEYAAKTKISDEYKEVDIAIGLSKIEAQINAAKANVGTNDMGTYCHILKTEDFARDISHVRLKDKGMTYGEYLEEKDTIETVLDHIEYNYSSSTTTLTIQFTDRDPVVAAEMLDSVTMHLQQRVTSYRQRMARAALADAEAVRQRAWADYLEAQANYSDYMDTHNDILLEKEKGEEKILLQDMNLTREHYEEATEKCVRYKAIMHRATLAFAVVQSNSVPHQSNRHFLSYLLSFIIIALILTKAYLLFTAKRRAGTLMLDWGDLFSPWSLTIGIWVGDILLYFLQGTLYPLGPQFLGCFALWLATFLPASLIAFWLAKDDRITTPPDFNKPIAVHMGLFYFLIVISMLLTLLYAKTILNIASQFDTENLLYNIRLLAIYKTESFGVLNHAQGINLALFLTGIWLYPRISKLTLAVIVVINLVLELAMMEKSGILIMILGAIFVLYERGKIRKQTIMLTFVGIIVLFFFFNMSKEEADSEESMDFMDFFGMYITSPMVAFERLRMTITDSFAANTLNDFYPQLERFGISISGIDRLQEFVFVPIPTNVYTIMQPFYNDFGRPGVAFFGFLYGSLFGYAYRKFREGNDMYKCFYAYLVEVIIIQFYNENLLQVFHLVMEAGIVIIMLTSLSKVSFTLSTQKACAP